MGLFSKNTVNRCDYNIAVRKTHKRRLIFTQIFLKIFSGFLKELATETNLVFRQNIFS